MTESAAPAHPCYHCGLPIPADVDLSVNILEQTRAVCCVGCQAVAEAIVANGLADYYRNRDAMPESPREAKPAILDQLALFDHAEFQKSFVRASGEHEREASLMLEGITCAACVWLNERQVGQLAGVTGVEVNYATRRARVRWDETRIKLSDILAAIAAIGYRAHPYDASRYEELAQKERRSALWRVWVAGFGMMQVMMYAVPAYIAGEGEMTQDIETLIRWASLLLTLPVVLYSAAPFFKGAWRDLKFLRVGMDVPVALGVGAAFAASVWATLTRGGEVYFDSVAMFVFFLLGGRYLEMTARQKAVSVGEALAKLMPAFCQRLPHYPAAGEAEQVMVSELKAGDTVLVPPGETIPCDGTVQEGASNANEALLTGESHPVKKTPGDRVTGGAVNVESPLIVRVDAIGEATRLSAIIRLMERAAAEKPGIVVVADRVAQWFVLAVLVVAALTAALWYWFDPSQALWITVSVLVVTCPCALALATPIALTVASGALAKGGLLVTRGHALETLARATHFVFDKTGTLTQGKMQLLDISASDAGEQALILAASLEQASEHPLAQALKRAAHERYPEATLAQVKDAQAETGQGISGEIAGRRLYIGRPDYVFAHSAPAGSGDWQAWQAAGDTVLALGDEASVLAFFRLGDDLRPEAKALIADLQASGCRTLLMSGDATPVAERVAAELGMDAVQGAMSPQAKRDAVKTLQAEGAIVAMVGDGVNDAPVLAQAQVSIAMGSGAQLARTQADLVLLSENLEHLRAGIQKSRFTLAVIRQNLTWAFLYNILALPLAIVGLVPPWAAGIGMSASSLLVVLNALRIQKTQTKES
ncbi:cation-transporting P-type ATPase [Betaproteobacteria bacterium]|nr:cation-transporting P-type ATPase [Betaproteobacteria bacterium]GHU48412.1 cation-transporting P-type ATPase [Betaproteobacteria bacterium]